MLRLQNLLGPAAREMAKEPVFQLDATTKEERVVSGLCCWCMATGSLRPGHAIALLRACRFDKGFI